MRLAFIWILITTAFIHMNAYGTDCSNIQGIYKGHYTDSTGLFPSTPFPISLYLTTHHGQVYGYTLPSQDQQGAGYGQKPYALFHAHCQAGALTDLYLLKKNPTLCGQPATGPFPIPNGTHVSVEFQYENSMIDALLNASLTRQKTNFIPNQALLTRAKKLNQTEKIPSCH